MRKTSVINFYGKYREQISYLFFGVLTTIVNYASFALLRYAAGDDRWIHAVNVATFVIATLFAFVTNKLFVFKSRNASASKVLYELGTFFGSRLSTFFIEWVGLYICTDFFYVGQYKVLFTDGTMIAKIVLSFVAVILNYFLSKSFIFKKKKGSDGNQSV